MINIALSGPESSGKTALAIHLAVHFKTYYVPEFARTYLEQTGRPYNRIDLRAIIKGQLSWWSGNALRLPADGLRFWDGDPAILRVWEDERFKMKSPEIEAFIYNTPPDLTLLCAPDLPWTYDPLRENPEDRQRLFERYQALLEHWELPYIIVTGTSTDRTQVAIQAVEQWLTTSR